MKFAVDFFFFANWMNHNLDIQELQTTRLNETRDDPTYQPNKIIIMPIVVRLIVIQTFFYKKANANLTVPNEDRNKSLRKSQNGEKKTFLLSLSRAYYIDQAPSPPIHHPILRNLYPSRTSIHQYQSCALQQPDLLDTTIRILNFIRPSIQSTSHIKSARCIVVYLDIIHHRQI